MTRTIVIVAALLMSCAPAIVEEEGTMLSDPKLGAFWFRMQDAEGEPGGYCRLMVTRGEDKSLSFSWELHLAFPGGTYEEERTMVLDAGRHWRSATMSLDGNFVADAKRDESKVVGKARVDGEIQEISAEIPDNVLTSLSFVVATMLPLEAGQAFSFPELNEASGFKDEGEASLTVVEKETLPGDIETWRVTMVRGGNEMPIWIREDRTIQQIDWGGGNLMIYSKENTEHLFQPTPPAVSEVPSDPDQLVVAGDFPGFTPQELYDHFTKEDLLVKWWPPKAKIELKEGGAYELDWAEGGWKLDGKVVAFEPGKRFVFTWFGSTAEEGVPPRTVEVLFTPIEGGTHLELTHSTYDDTPKDQEAKVGHLKGWEHFLTQLKALTPR